MRHWLRSYVLLLRWNLLRLRTSLPFLFIIQTLLSVGIVLGFSFLVPGGRPPDWLAAVHQWLPFQYMAQAMRETLDVPAGGVPVLPFAVLAAWGVAGLGFTYRIMTRRA